MSKVNSFFITLLSNLLNEMNHKDEFSLFIGCSRIAHLFKIDIVFQISKLKIFHQGRKLSKLKTIRIRKVFKESVSWN